MHADVRPAEPQTAPAVLMIRPVHAASNPETAASNRFQGGAGAGAAAAAGAAGRARDEFDAFAAALADAGVEVVVFDDPADPPAADAHFPNNWVTFHGDGTVVLYPMATPSRAREVHPELVERLADEHGFDVRRVVDLRDEVDRLPTLPAPRGAESAAGAGAARGEPPARPALEGTGSLVLDRVHRLAYACLSPRTDARLLDVFARALGYEPFVFDARDAGGVPVYHTNVVLSIGTHLAVLCAAAVRDPAPLVRRLAETGHDVVTVDAKQMAAFAANVLELDGADGPVLACSRRAWSALEPAQRARWERHVQPVPVDLQTIETLGGGSARCMLAEIFLPRSPRARRAPPRVHPAHG